MAEACLKDLKKIVSDFRVAELQALLNYAGRNKVGRKSELLHRALELVESGPCPAPISYKIYQLSKHRHNSASSNLVRDTSGQLIPPAQPTNSSLRSPALSPRRSASQRIETQSQPVEAPVAPQTPLPLSVPSSSNISSNSPFHPDVRLKHLPFYDMKKELLKPSSLSAVASSAGVKNYLRAVFTFCLTPQQVSKITKSRVNELLNDDCGIVEYGTQIQLRFCLAETTCEQDDFFPPNIVVRVNHQEVQLPSLIPSNKQGVEPKRPGRPVNITTVAKLSSTAQNTIHVTWSPQINRDYCLAVYLVKQLTSVDLMIRLRLTGIRHPDHTRALIKEKLAQSSDSEISTTSLRISLLCPLSKTRMMVPCRPSSCRHLQCFDAASFLQMNEKKSTWLCPVCDKEAMYSTLIIDGLFTEILTKAPDSNDIQFAASGQWSPIVQKEEKSKKADTSIYETIPDSPEPMKTVELIDLTETDEEEDVRPTSRASSLCLSSGSSEPMITSMQSGDTPLPFYTPKDALHGYDHPTISSSRGSHSPPVLSHFLDYQPWNNYYMTNLSHSATSSLAATSGDMHAVMRPRSANEIDALFNGFTCESSSSTLSTNKARDLRTSSTDSQPAHHTAFRRPSSTSDSNDSQSTAPYESQLVDILTPDFIALD